MFRPWVPSRRAYLQAMKGLVLSSSPLPEPRGVGGVELPFCADGPGNDRLMTLEEVLSSTCGDCKKLSILAARRYIEAGARRVDLCMTVTPPPQDEHVFLRVDGRFVDPAVEAGMPTRQIGYFIAETVWEAPP